MAQKRKTPAGNPWEKLDLALSQRQMVLEEGSDAGIRADAARGRFLNNLRVALNYKSDQRGHPALKTQINAWLDQGAPKDIQVLVDPQGHAVVRGTVPLINDTNTLSAVGIDDNMLAGAILFDLSAAGTGPDLTSISQNPRVYAGYNLRAVQVLLKENPKFRESFFKDDMTSITTRFEEVTQDYRNAAGHFADAEAAAKTVQAQNQAMLNALKERKEQLEGEFKALRDQIIEAGKLAAAETFFRTKKNSHNIGFYVCFGIFMLSIFGLVGGLILHFGAVESHLISVLRPETSIGAAVIFTVPVALIFWILRAFSKLAMQQNSLATDAAMRETMVRVFVALSGSGDGLEVTREERLVMLTTIFRPLGADSGDDVHPPGIADLAALVKGGRSS